MDVVEYGAESAPIDVAEGEVQEGPADDDANDQFSFHDGRRGLHATFAPPRAVAFAVGDLVEFVIVFSLNRIRHPLQPFSPVVEAGPDGA